MSKLDSIFFLVVVGIRVPQSFYWLLSVYELHLWHGIIVYGGRGRVLAFGNYFRGALAIGLLHKDNDRQLC